MTHDFADFQQECFDIARRSGFHDTDIATGAPNWEHISNLELARRLLLVICEVVEGFEELRNGAHPCEIYYKEGKPEGLPIELADVVIRVFNLAQAHYIDMTKAINIKMEYNKTRPYLHGKAF